MSDDIIPCCGSGDLVGFDLDAFFNNSLIFCCVSYIMIKLSVNTVIVQTEGDHTQQQCSTYISDEHV